MEEVGYHSLITDDWEDQHIDADTADGDGEQFLVITEHADACLREYLADNPTHGHRDHRGSNGQPQDALDAVHIACSVVIARDGLEALADADDDHEEDESQTVGDAVGAHGKVTAILHQGIVHEDGDHTARNLHGERRDADADDILDDGLSGF